MLRRWRRNHKHGCVTIWAWSILRWPELDVCSVEPALVRSSILWRFARNPSNLLLPVQVDALEIIHALRRRFEALLDATALPMPNEMVAHVVEERKCLLEWKFCFKRSCEAQVKWGLCLELMRGENRTVVLPLDRHYIYRNGWVVVTPSQFQRLGVRKLVLGSHVCSRLVMDMIGSDIQNSRQGVGYHRCRTEGSNRCRCLLLLSVDSLVALSSSARFTSDNNCTNDWQQRYPRRK